MSTTDVFVFSWGKAKEATAKNAFIRLLREQGLHKGFLFVADVGLRISTEHPFLAASCDFLFDCPCVACKPLGGRAVGEIKCPWSHRDEMVRDAARKDKDFALCVDHDSGELKMKTNHAYYFQMQVQMLVTKRSFGFFVCYTTKDTQYVTVHYDSHFIETLLSPARDFFVQVMLPELVAKHFTRQFKSVEKIDSNHPKSCDEGNNASYLPCICQKSDENLQTLRCSNEECVIKMFHVQCILKMLKRKTLPRVFTCSDCKKLVVKANKENKKKEKAEEKAK